MFRIADLVIRIAVDIVGQETDSLHVREQSYRIRQHLNFYRSQERRSRFQVSLHERLEYFDVEMHLVQVRFIFGAGIGSRTEEITEIGEYEARHHGIQVDNAQYLTLFVEQHVAHFRIAMTDTFRQFALTIQLFGATHLFCILFDGIYQSLHLFQTTGRIGSNRFAQLLQTELHVMEIRNGFAQLFRDIGQHGFEFAELQTYQVR